MSSTSSLRETEFATLAACRWEPARFQTSVDGPWTLCAAAAAAAANSADAADLDDVSVVQGVMSQPACSVRIAPMDRVLTNLQQNAPLAQWKEEHFSHQLQLPSCNKAPSLTLQFEGMARESVAVLLSPRIAPSSARKTYDVVLGAQGNTLITLRKSMRGSSKQKNQNAEPTCVTVPGRVCQAKAWTRYWICLSMDKLYVGVGEIPGTNCVALLQDDDDTNNNDSADTAADAADAPLSDDDWIRYIGLGNTSVSDRQAASPVRVRNVALSTVPPALAQTLQTIQADALPLQVLVDEDNDMDQETKTMFAKYKQECQKARARATKFGVAYKQPPASSFLPWSQVRKLRANPTAGFCTGMDLSDPVEKAKQEARKARFGVRTASSEAAQSKDNASNDNGTETTAAGEATAKGGMQQRMQGLAPNLPLEQAWDNEQLVSSHRADPPASLWKDPPHQEQAEERDEYAMQMEAPMLTPEKIHIFSIDWAAFKQIRTNDIMKHFSMYGPTYVEWLGDLSCNVQFQDRFSAARALENLSLELPSPPPETIEARAPAEDGNPTERIPDFGKMGWRFGKGLLCKIANDRYGKRGTTVRLLMRLSTSLDVLMERPNAWPKPPPGFTTKRVLGPGSDFPSNHTNNKSNNNNNKKRQKKRSREPLVAQEKQQTHNTNKNADPEALLSRGLSAARDGFSMEELEAERAKKAKKS